MMAKDWGHAMSLAGNCSLREIRDMHFEDSWVDCYDIFTNQYSHCRLLGSKGQTKSTKGPTVIPMWPSECSLDTRVLELVASLNINRHHNVQPLYIVHVKGQKTTKGAHNYSNHHPQDWSPMIYCSSLYLLLNNYIYTTAVKFSRYFFLPDSQSKIEFGKPDKSIVTSLLIKWLTFRLGNENKCFYLLHYSL